MVEEVEAGHTSGGMVTVVLLLAGCPKNWVWIFFLYVFLEGFPISAVLISEHGSTFYLNMFFIAKWLHRHPLLPLLLSSSLPPSFSSPVQSEKAALLDLQVQLAAAEAAMEELGEQQRLEVEMVKAERDAALLELRVKQVTELNASEELVAEAQREAEEGRAAVGRLQEEQVGWNAVMRKGGLCMK